MKNEKIKMKNEKLLMSEQFCLLPFAFCLLPLALLRSKLTKASEVILCDNKAKNTGIAIATASIFNEVSVQKSKLEWSSYFLAMPLYFILLFFSFSFYP